MIDGTIVGAGGMMLGMGATGLLAIVVLHLAAARAKYVSSNGRGRRGDD